MANLSDTFKYQLPWPFPKTQTLSRLFPLLLHQKLVRHQGDEFAVGGDKVVVAKEGIKVLDTCDASRPKRLVGLLVALIFPASLVHRHIVANQKTSVKL